jgi:hypothetical protein
MKFTDIINSFVVKIIDGRFKIPHHSQVHRDDKIHINLSDNFIDHQRELKSILTDVVVNEFLQSDDEIFNTLIIVNDMFTYSIKEYIRLKKLRKEELGYPGDIFFTFKGGNILRVIFNELLKEMHGSVTKLLEDYYSPYFKRSDADFTIYINPKLDNYDEIFEDMTNLSFYVQSHLRKFFSIHLEKYFTFYRLNNDEQKKILKKTLDKMNSIHALTDETNDDFYNGKFVGLEHANVSHFTNNNYNSVNITHKKIGTYRKLVTGNTTARHDYSMQVIDKNNPNTKVMFNLNDGKTRRRKKRHSNNKNNMYIGNNLLEFVTAGKNKMKMKFALVRTKINFVAHMEKDGNKYRINIGGEFLDCSIIHRDSTQIGPFFKNVKYGIRDYVIKGPSGTEMHLKGYSLRDLTEDLYLILFKVVDKPWMDEKYYKRIKRLFLMYLLDILIKIDVYDRLEYIDDFIENVLISYNTNEFENISKFTEKYMDRNLFMNDFVGELERLHEIVINSNSEYEKKEFRKFLDLVGENIEVARSAFLLINNYDGSIDGKELYNTSIESLSGGSDIETHINDEFYDTDEKYNTSDNNHIKSNRMIPPFLVGGNDSNNSNDSNVINHSNNSNCNNCDDENGSELKTDIEYIDPNYVYKYKKQSGGNNSYNNHLVNNMDNSSEMSIDVSVDTSVLSSDANNHGDQYYERKYLKYKSKYLKLQYDI